MSTWQQLPPLTWPDTVAVTCDYLRAGLVGVAVAAKVPDPRPSALVVVERAGGPSQGLWEIARLAIQAWGTTPEQAADTVGACRDLLGRMKGVRGGFTVYGVTEFGGPNWVPDPETQLPRYLFTVEARFRANPKGP